MVLGMVILSVMADTKRSFNDTQAMAKPKMDLEKTQPAKKPVSLRITPEERRKLSLFPKNTVKFVATTKAPPKKIDNSMRRKNALLPKMAKQVQAPAYTTTEGPPKATTIYNFRPTRAPKLESKRFSNNPRFATTVPSVTLKNNLAYRKDLYRRNEDLESMDRKPTRPVLFGRIHGRNIEEHSHKDEPHSFVRKDASVLKKDKNGYQDESQEDRYSDEDELISQEDDQPMESREDDGIKDTEAESSMINVQVVRVNHIGEILTRGMETSTVNLVINGKEIKKSFKETTEEDEEVKGIVEEKAERQSQKNKMEQAALGADFQVTTETFTTKAYLIDKRYEMFHILRYLIAFFSQYLPIPTYLF